MEGSSDIQRSSSRWELALFVCFYTVIKVYCSFLRGGVGERYPRLYFLKWANKSEHMQQCVEVRGQLTETGSLYQLGSGD